MAADLLVSRRLAVLAKSGAIDPLPWLARQWLGARAADEARRGSAGDGGGKIGRPSP